MRRLVLGTRGSALALWQARHVAARLRHAHPSLELEERIIKTEGDGTTGWIGFDGRGVFVRAIEDRLAGGEIDLAVHSMKDLPTSQPDGLAIAAVPERHEPSDVVLSERGWTFDEIPRGATIATGSYRRRCQLLAARPDLRAVPVRGNVDTRLRKLRDKQFDVLVLARAGVERLGLDQVPARPIPLEVCLPAVGQGALAVESRASDDAVRNVVSVLHDTTAAAAVAAERAFLRRLGGGCLAPATAHAVIDDGQIEIRAVVGDPDGTRLMREQAGGAVVEGERLAEELAARMLEAGAAELLAAARRAAENPPPS